MYIGDYKPITFTATNGEIPANSVITATVEGSLSLSDFYIDLGDPIILSGSERSGYIAFYETAKGKSGKITFTSEYVTFADGAGITVDFSAL